MWKIEIYEDSVAICYAEFENESDAVGYTARAFVMCVKKGVRVRIDLFFVE